MSPFGSAKDHKDTRDEAFEKKLGGTALKKRRKPHTVPVRRGMPPAWQQLPLSSCTAHAVSGAMWHLMARDRDQLPFEPSRMFLYYHSLLYQRDQNAEDDPSFLPHLEATAEQGVGIRAALKAAVRYGTCEESLWPHPALKITDWSDVDAIDADTRRMVDAATDQALRANPDSQLYEAIALYRGVKITSYSRLKKPSGAAITRAISLGYPIVFSFGLYESFKKAAGDGHVPLPSKKELRGSPLGLHAMVAIAYDDQAHTVTARNSFGPGWGDGGYAHVPFAFFPKHIVDAWVVEGIERTEGGLATRIGPRGRPKPRKRR